MTHRESRPDGVGETQFAGRLRRQFERLPDNDVPPAPKLRRRPLLVLAVTAGVALLLVALSLGASSEGPSEEDLREMQRQIQEWETVSWRPWPSAHYTADSLPDKVHEAMQAERLDVARRVGTEDFVRSREVQRDIAAYLEEFHKGGEPLQVEAHQRVLDVTFDRVEPDGDMVVRALVWIGQVTAYWDEAEGGLTRYDKIDTTPVYEFTMRKTAGEWRIVRKRQVVQSEDASSSLFGPDTPHEQFTPVPWDVPER